MSDTLLKRLIPVLGALSLAGTAWGQVVSVSSPNGQVVVTVDSQPNAPLSYAVQFHGQSVLAPSALGVTVDGQNLGQNVFFHKPAIREKKETYPIVGKHRTATNDYQEAILSAVSGEAKTRWQLELRVFNDGVAYRYRVPETGTHQINGESSQWALPAGSTLWYQSDRNKSYEAPFRETKIDNVAPDFTMATSTTVKLPGNTGYAMLTEANLVNYSDMSLRNVAPNTFQALFSNDTQGWANDGEIVSPWRVTLLAEDLNTLVNSDIIPNLCPPPSEELANAKWIQPGRSIWHWMVTGNPRLAAQHQWVDWTKQVGFEYYLIDDGWVRWRNGGQDQWACIKEVVDYATTKGVKIFAWVHSDELQTTEARATYFQKAKDAGLVGLKIDFPPPASAKTVQWYEDTLRDLAKYQLMVDFHGAVKPTGRERTWPHEVTREAIFGRESGKLPGLHDTTLPFTRLVQGHADYTPTELRPDKLGGSRWSHELAQAIVYTSPFLCYSGSPESYLSNTALDILRAIPATWDETVVLPGSEIGQVAAFARRKGDTWFIAVINSEETRNLTLDLSFLGKGQYRVDSLADSLECKDGWNRTLSTLNRKDKIETVLLKNGGFVARLVPIR